MSVMRMIEGQLLPSGVSDRSVIEAFERTPREAFVPDAYQGVAYADATIPLPGLRVLWTPLDCGRVLQNLKLESHHKVLLVGGESGYLAALLSHLVAEVIVVEPDEAWVQHLRELFQTLGLSCQCVVGQALEGWQEGADRIIVTGVLPQVPAALLESLDAKGLMFVITGEKPARKAVIMTPQGICKELFETEGPLLPGAMESSFKF